MHLIFFDEVKPQPDYHHYHIGGISIAENDLSLIEKAISEIAIDVFNHDRLTASTEFHAADIYHRKKSFKEFTDFSVRIEILIRFFQILSKPEVNLINIQVNVDKLYANQSAPDIAFMFLCERANALMRSQNSIGMLIGDRENDSTSERFSIDLSQYRANGTFFTYGEEIKNLFESVHFTHSHLSRFLQLADMYAWILQFRNRHLQLKDPRHQALLDLMKEREISLFPSKYKQWPK